MTAYVQIYQKHVRMKKFFSFFRRNHAFLAIFFFIIFSAALVIIDAKNDTKNDAKNDVKFLSFVRNKINNFFYSIVFFNDFSFEFKNFYKNSIFGNANKSISEEEYKNIIDSIEKLYISENQQLKTLLNFIDGNNIDRNKIVTTKAIIDLKNHTIILKCGKNSNLRTDQLIINDIGLVGKITEVYEDFSKGILITNKKFKIPVISAENNYRFILNGQDTNELKALYLSDQLNDNEILLLSNNIYTKNIKIARFNVKENKIKPFINSEKVNFVSIIYDNN